MEQMIITLILCLVILILWNKLREGVRIIKKQAHIGINRRSGESPIITPIVKDSQEFKEFKEIRSLADSFTKSMEKYKDLDYLNVKINHQKEVSLGNKWTSSSFSTVYKQALGLGSGFIGLGLKASQEFCSVNTDLQESMVGIFLKNSYFWIVADHACSLNSLVSVPIHDSYTITGVTTVLNHSKLTALVTSLDKVKDILDSSPKYLKVIVVVHDSSSRQLIPKSSLIRIISIIDLIESGQKQAIDNVLPSSDHVFTICYTSGTTGDPKGVIITHRNMVEAGKGLLKVVPGNIMPGTSDCHLSFLPMSHIFERMNIHALTWCGVKIGLGSGQVLELPREIMEFKPTIFPTVPRLLTRVYSKVMEKLESLSNLKRIVFNIGLQYKMNLLKHGVISKNTIWDKLIFSKISEKLGGRIKFIATGAAPVDPKVINFYRVILGCEIIEGYGQTESCGTGTCTRVGDYENPWDSHVGPPFPGLQLKLVDVPSLGYFATDKPNPRGEVCLFGLTIMKGYYREELKTNQTIKDGWLHTGDVGQILPNGTLQIIDRVSNIFKLAQGEFICPEKIENKLDSKYISQIVIFGNSLDSYCIALVTPEPDLVKQWAEKNDRSHLDLKQLYQDPFLVDEILNDIIVVGKNNGLLGYEIPRMIELLDEPLTVESGFLTPSLKIKRKLVEQSFHGRIQELRKKL